MQGVWRVAEDGDEENLAGWGEEVEAGVGGDLEGFVRLGRVEVGVLGGWRGKGGSLVVVVGKVVEERV